MDIKLRSARHAVAVTPSNTVDLPRVPSKGLYVTATGNVVFVTSGGDTVTLTSVAANTLLPFEIARVKATGTTATVLALY